jgi:hypothetical protein
VSDVAASLLNVWSCASSLGLRTRRGRTLLQQGESKDNLPTTVVVNVCPSHCRFQPISRDLEAIEGGPILRSQGGRAGSNPLAIAFTIDGKAYTTIDDGQTDCSQMRSTRTWRLASERQLLIISVERPLGVS